MSGGLRRQFAKRQTVALHVLSCLCVCACCGAWAHHYALDERHIARLLLPRCGRCHVAAGRRASTETN